MTTNDPTDPTTASQLATDVDALPPTQYLVMETLAARHRLGEQFWTFPHRIASAAIQALEGAGLVWSRAAPTPGAVQVSLTDAGRAAVLHDSYQPPAPQPATPGELDLDAITDGATGWDRDWIAQLPGHLPSSAYLAPDLAGRAQREIAALLADVDRLAAEVRRLRDENERIEAARANLQRNAEVLAGENVTLHAADLLDRFETEVRRMGLDSDGPDDSLGYVRSLRLLVHLNRTIPTEEAL